jgi:DNA polymerase III delta prime subunit
LRALLDEVDRDGHMTAPLFLFLCNSLYRVHQSLRSRCVALFCGHVPINYVREALLEIQHAEGVAEPRLPSDTTFSLLRGDMRSFVAAIQNDAELNPWDDWFAELERTCGATVWEAGLSRAPFCILIRHVFLWMNTHGMLDVAGAADFIDTCLRVQDAPQSVIATVVSAAFDRLRGAGAQN